MPVKAVRGVLLPSVTALLCVWMRGVEGCGLGEVRALEGGTWKVESSWVIGGYTISQCIVRSICTVGYLQSGTSLGQTQLAKWDKRKCPD